MEAILQGLMDLAGVSATMVFDGTGQLVAHRAHTLYDRALCEQVSGTLVKAIDSIQLRQEDWDSITARFADGKLILRSLVVANKGMKYVLAIVADATLNASFATVAIRVAANKLRKAIEGGTGAAAAASGVAAVAPLSGSQPVRSRSQPPSASGAHPTASSPRAPVPSDSRPALANSGLSWSSAVSGVTVADPASSAFLIRCVKELAKHVGPIAKVYAQESVRRVSPDAPFSISLGRQLVQDLATQIEDADDQARFLVALDKS